MSEEPKPTLEREATKALNGLLLMSAGTFALVMQNLRDFSQVLGTGPTRWALVALALSAVFSCLARMATVVDLIAPDPPDRVAMVLGIVLFSLVALALAAYFAFVCVVVCCLGSA